jgi:hypothetical protein
MKYAFEMGSGGMPYILIFVRLIQAFKSWRGDHAQTHKQQDHLISLVLFFLIRKIS